MLPPFDESGNLPRGIHVASMEEIADRFGHGSPEREVEIRELVDFIAWARQNGVRRIIINGSFVTEKRDPNDVDVILLPPQDERHREPCSRENQCGLSFKCSSQRMRRTWNDGPRTILGQIETAALRCCGGDPMVARLSQQGYEQNQGQISQPRAAIGGDRTPRGSLGRTTPRGVPFVPRDDAAISP